MVGISTLKKLLVSLCLFATSALLPALSPDRHITQYNIEHWNLEQGLPSNTVYTILQSRLGYLWLGTQDGLIRFDGLQFEVLNVAKYPKLGSNSIRALHEDREGFLWVGTDSGGLSRYKDGEFIHFPVKDFPFLKDIRTLCTDKWGKLWIGSFTNGLTRFSNGSFQHQKRSDSLPDYRVRTIRPDKQQNLWITTSTDILEMSEPWAFKIHAPNTPFAKTVSLFHNESGDLWIGTSAQGLARKQENCYTLFGKGDGLPDLTITCMLPDKSGSIWFGTDDGGLVRMQTDKSTPFTSILAGTSVYSLFEDREGSLWVGTLDNGLYQLKDNKFTTYSTTEGLLHDYVSCVMETEKGDILIGTKAGLSRLHDDLLQTVLTRAKGLLHDTVTSLLDDGDGGLWIGTLGGLNFYKNGKLSAFTRRDGLPDNHILHLQEGGAGSLYIGTAGGLAYKTPDSKFTIHQSLIGIYIECLFRDAEGRLWVGTDTGMNYVTGDSITPFPLPPGVTSDSFRSVSQGRDRSMWFGTNNGLLRVKDGVPTVFTTLSGLLENHVYVVMEDTRGYLWLAGRNGISRVPIQELTDFAANKIMKVKPQWYNENDGLKSRWNTGDGFTSRDGRMWFPTSQGVAVIAPTEIKTNQVPPNVIIEKIAVDGDILEIHQQKEEIRLGPGIKRLTFFYTGISFLNAGDIQFKLKLFGFDTDWEEMGTQRSTTYTGLTPGQYRLMVNARNSDGTTSEKEASFSFYLEPYFYQTAWFYVVAGLLLILLVTAVVRFRLRNLKLQALQLSSLVDERTSDLENRNRQLQATQEDLRSSNNVIEAKNRQLESQSEQLKELDIAKTKFFTNISHEFRTPLTLIIGPLENILSDNPDAHLKDQAQLMLRNSRRLLDLVNQLLELARFDSGKMRLKASLHKVSPFIANVVGCFKPLAVKNNVNLTIVQNNAEPEVYFDPEKLEKIISNLLSNAFNYTPKNGSITITVTHRKEDATFPQGSIDIAVQDTGAGIPAEQIPFIFNRFFRGKNTHQYLRKGSGIGLSLTRELVLLHRGRIEVVSRCTNDKNRGTCFTITLPVGKEHLQKDEAVDMSTDDLKNMRAEQKSAGSPLFYDDTEDDVNAEPDDETAKNDAAEEQEKKNKSPQKPLVLVVEDNEDVREHIKNSLRFDFRIVEAGDGDDGIRQAIQLVPDLVISDIMMPIKDGLQLCGTLKNDIATSHIPIILLTARVSDEYIIQGLNAGANDYITKPFSTQVLSARVQNLIELCAQMQMRHMLRMELQQENLNESDMDDQFMKQLEIILEANLSTANFNVDALSRELKMSQATLYRKLHALTGDTPTRYIRSYRIKRSAQIIAAGGNTPIADIALSVGFPDRSYFARCFKNQFHCLPSDYPYVGFKASDPSVEAMQTDSMTATPITEENTPTEKINKIDAIPLILVVEDNQDARTFIRKALEPKYRVEEAVDGAEGIKKALALIPDMIISDVMMPDTDGFELCRQLKKHISTSHVPIVLLTAKVSEDSVVKGLKQGADDYITKPFNTEILLTRIDNLIHLRLQMQRQRIRQMALMPSFIGESKIDKEFITEVHDIMDKNLSNSEFNVEQLARKLYLSSATLYRKLQALTGEIPSHYIRSYRLHRAVDMLKNSQLSITEVAFEVGFGSRSYFTRCFREKFHHLPSIYKSSND